jgi:hypothetical protein
MSVESGRSVLDLLTVVPVAEKTSETLANQSLSTSQYFLDLAEVELMNMEKVGVVLDEVDLSDFE